jgi:hypothetical protein
MGMDFLYHTFVPVCTLESRNGKARLYKTLTLMLYNLINHPNLMGARRSCGQSLVDTAISDCCANGLPIFEMITCHFSSSDF